MVNLAIGYIVLCVLGLAVLAHGIVNAKPLPRQNLEGYSSEQKPDADTRAIRKHRTWADAELTRTLEEAREEYS